MAKTKNETAGSVAVQDPPKAPPLKNWKFNLRSPWINPILVLTGLPDEQAARRKLHELLDQAIVAVETTR